MKEPFVATRSTNAHNLPGRYCIPFRLSLPLCIASLAAALAAGISSHFFAAALFIAMANYCWYGYQEDPDAMEPATPGDGPPAAGAPMMRGGEPELSPTPTPAAVYGSLVRDGYRGIRFLNVVERRYETACGRRLVVGRGEIRGHVAMNICRSQEGQEQMDIVECSLRLADDSGGTWECRQLMLPYLLTDPIEPGATLPEDGFFFRSDAPQSWREALQRPLVGGIRLSLDTGDKGVLKIGDSEHAITFRKQELSIDLAYLDSQALFIVAITDLKQQMNATDGGNCDPTIPPFCYALPADELLFFEAPLHYFSYQNEWYAMEEGIRKKHPLFNCVPQSAPPQPLVTVAA